MKRDTLPSTAVIAPGAWPSLDAEPLPSTAVMEEEETILPLDPNESDAAWEARIIALCSPRVVLGVRD